MNIEGLKKLGNEWSKGSKGEHHRIYFNDLTELAGVEYTTYGTGNISSVKMGGKRLSNAKGGEIVNALESGKLWFDVNAGRFEYRLRDTREYRAEELTDIIIKRIKELVDV